jgi:hypothetical protein
VNSLSLHTAATHPSPLSLSLQEEGWTTAVQRLEILFPLFILGGHNRVSFPQPSRIWHGQRKLFLKDAIKMLKILCKTFFFFHQDFKEYAAQLEEILLQKQACIETLQEKLKIWKTTM